MFQYVSNAGIIFEIDGKRVGIDCLCKDSLQLYKDTPEAIREEMRLDVIIFTHEHEDHFCAEYVKDAWEKNSELQIYSTKKVIECLQNISIPKSNLNEVQDGTVLRVGDLQIRFCETLHEGAQYSDIQNLSLLINKEDKHLVVTGDAMPCRELFAKIAEWSPHLEWLFAPFPYVGLKSNRKLICEHLTIYNIFMLHLPKKETDRQGWTENTKKICEQAKDELPFPIFPESLGKWHAL